MNKLALDTARSVNPSRIKSSFDAVSKIGKSQRGMNRLAYSQSNKSALSILIEWMKETNLEVSIDPMHNVFAKMSGSAAYSKSILTGSHIDTVIDGGRFDGTIGVIAGLECLRAISELGLKTRKSVVLAVFAGEESVRFTTGTLGSKAIVGDLTKAELYKLKDSDGITLAEAIRQFGGDPDRIEDCRKKVREIESMIELHIEQGPVLDKLGKPIGIVEDIVSIDRLIVIITGESVHSGSGASGMRRDALAAASEVVLFVESINNTYTNVRATVGKVEVYPGTLNTVPGETSIGIDLRVHGNRDKYRTLLQSGISHICRRRRVGFDIKNVFHQDASKMSRRIIGVISRRADKMHIEPYRLTSFGGHDALVMAKIIETGMIFIPCRRGISHNRAEWADIEHIKIGTQLLLASILDLAGVE